MIPVSKSDTILSIELVTKNAKRIESVLPGHYQLNKGAFIVYASREILSIDDNNHYVLNFIVPKSVLNEKGSFYLAPPIEI